MGLSFQRFSGSVRRLVKRLACSSRVTANQYLIRWMPCLTSRCSNSGASSRKAWDSSREQKPMTRSTPARLYQERSKRTISPAEGRCST